MLYQTPATRLRAGRLLPFVVSKGDEMSLADDTKLRLLLARVRELPPMTPDERVEQGFSFAYGNLACTTNHKPNRAAFRTLALEEGWTEERFNTWASDKEWWMGKMLMQVPIRSEATLMQLRARRVAEQDEHGLVLPAEGYTCDECGVKPTCVFVFDPYNTNGDCLAEK